MRRVTSLIATAALLFFCAIPASAQTAVFDFEDGTDQGFGGGFGNDASISFPIVNIGGSLRMEVTDDASFQQAGRETSNPADPWYVALAAAAANEAFATLSYDWYIDTSLAPGTNGTFLQLGSYINSGSGYYAQNFPGSGKEVELDGTQLSSGQVFSGTVSINFAAVGYNIPAADTFFRPGVISNGDGTGVKIYYDNITLSVVPEPASLGLLSLATTALLMSRRRFGC